ncbi:MAG TPA: hypothetical protein VF608_12465, partial [Thermoanaerobaculia bacterium]
MRTAIALSLLLTSAVSAAELQGVIRNESSAPLAKAHVYVYAAHPKTGVATVCANCYRDCGKRRETDAAGKFMLSGLDPTLKFEILAVADGYEPQLVRVTDTTQRLEFTMHPRTNADADRLIIGVVVDPDGKPVVGALVEPSGYHTPPRKMPNGREARLTGYGNVPNLDELSITNDKGEFALRIPDAGGMLDVRAKSLSYAPKIVREFVPKQSKTIQLGEGALIQGRVARDGKPLGGISVSFVQRNRASSGFLGQFEIGTDENGNFVMPNLGPDEEWVVYVQKSRLDDGVINPTLVKTGAAKSKADAGTLTVSKGRCITGKVVADAATQTLPQHVRLVH